MLNYLQIFRLLYKDYIKIIMFISLLLSGYTLLIGISPLFIKSIINNLDNNDLFFRNIIIITLILFTKSLLLYFSGIYKSRLLNRRNIKLKLEILRSYLNSDLLINDTIGHSNIFHIQSNTTNEVTSTFLNIFLTFSQDILILIISIILLIRLNAAVLLVCALYYLILYSFHKIREKHIKRLSNIHYKARERAFIFVKRFFDCYINVNTVSYSWTYPKADDLYKKYEDATNSLFLSKLINKKVTDVFSELLPLFLLVMFVVKGQTDLGTLVAIMTYLNYISGPLNRLIMLNNEYQGALISYNKIIQIINNANFISSISQDKTEVDSVSLEQVSFHFNESTHKILSMLNYNFKLGGLYVISGISGSGKTTLLKILCGLYNPVSGRIKINSDEHKDIKLYYKYNVFFLEQNPMFMSDNLIDVFPIKKVEDIDRIHSILYDFGFEQNFDIKKITQCNNMSLGERKKIAMTLCVFLGYKYILLDEPTSGLEQNSRTKIMNIVKQLSQKSMVVVATHDNDLINIGNYNISL